MIIKYLTKTKTIKTMNKLKIITITLLLLLTTVTFSILITKNIKKQHKKEITQLKSKINNLNYIINTKTIVTDSLISILESSDYLYFIIEKEASTDLIKFKIPNHVNPKFIKYMYETAISKNIPIDIMFRLVKKESSFYNNATSYVGAYGFMQLMPRTYRVYCQRLNIDQQPYTEEKNIYIGTYMLAELYEHWYKKIEKLNFSDNIEREAWEHTLASYNAGITRVKYYGVIFNNEGVSNYIAYITENF